MNSECNVGWNHDFVIETFTKSWYNGPYQQHRKDVLFSREEARLQETMEYLQFINDVVEYYDREKYKIDIDRVNNQSKLPALKDQLAFCKDVNKTLELKNTTNLIYEKNEENNRREYLLGDLLKRTLVVVWGSPQQEGEQQRIQNIIYNGVDIVSGLVGSSGNVVQRKQFTMPCPKDDCHGFLSQRYKCGVCSIYVCPHCHETKGGENDEEHICDDNLVKSVQLIKKDSKSCPSCHSLIHRYEGCPQMWCTQCKVAFDWRTGKIETGPVHNPHYADWLRQNNPDTATRTMAIRACGADISQERFSHIFYRFKITNKSGMGHYDIIAMIGTIYHMENVELHDLRRKINAGIPLEKFKPKVFSSRIMPGWSFDYEPVHYNLDQGTPRDDPNRRLRLCYLLNLIDKETAKTCLQRHEKTRVALTAWYNLYEMFINAGKDILVQLENFLVENQRNHTRCIEEIEKAYQQLIKVCQYFNYHSAKLYHQQNKKSVTIRFSDRFTIIRTYPAVSASIEDKLPSVQETPPRAHAPIRFIRNMF